jgi:hypothetical protein
MIELCPRQHLDSPFFLYFFLQRLPREIHMLLVEEDPKDVRQITEKVDCIIAMHVPQHHDTVAVVVPSSNEDTTEVAAVKQCRRHRGSKKRGKGGKQKQDSQESTLCWYHATYTEKAQPGKLDTQGGVLSVVRTGSLSNSHQQFLVDSGSSFSIIPFSSTSPQHGPHLTVANDCSIACWGIRSASVALSGITYQWRFLRAAAKFPILGADF